jgi:hypothetical protein
MSRFNFDPSKTTRPFENLPDMSDIDPALALTDSVITSTLRRRADFQYNGEMNLMAAVHLLQTPEWRDIDQQTAHTVLRGICTFTKARVVCRVATISDSTTGTLLLSESSWAGHEVFATEANLAVMATDTMQNYAAMDSRFAEPFEKLWGDAGIAVSQHFRQGALSVIEEPGQA